MSKPVPVDPAIGPQEPRRGDLDIFVLLVIGWLFVVLRWAWPLVTDERAWEVFWRSLPY